MSYHLSLDGAADEADDLALTANGIPFLVEARLRHLVPGLRIEVQRVLGREGLVARNAAGEPGGCD